MKKTLFAFAALCLAFVNACSGVSPEVSESKGLVLNGPRWPNPQAIPVCWTNGDAIAGEVKDMIRNLVQYEYHRKTSLRFVRFDNCRDEDYNKEVIRVLIDNKHDWDNNSVTAGLSWLGPVSAGLGDYYHGTRATMVIEFGRSGNFPQNDLRNYLVNSIKYISLHEFGHAVGLNHEHHRTDAPACGNESRLPPSENWVYVGGYDHDSVMNYCKPGGRGADNPVLSAGDVAAVGFLYPKKAPTVNNLDGEFYIKAKHSNHCLDIAEGSKDTGANVQQWECNGTSAQRFRFESAGDNSYRIKNVQSGKCLDVEFGAKQDGVKLWQWDCSDSPAQKVEIRNVADGFKALKFAHSGKCLDVKDVSHDLRAGLQQWQCYDNSENQSFGFHKAN